MAGTAVGVEPTISPWMTVVIASTLPRCSFAAPADRDCI